MSSRYLGIALIIVGLLVILVSLLADVIGIGANLYVFGWKQILGTCIGVVVCIAGIIISRRK
jgi:Mn2+/Fe2+ NRAMP family transporter